MGSHKFGFPALTQRSTPGSNFKNPKKSKKSQSVRVIDIIMDEKHPLIQSGKKGPSDIGLVICVGSTPNNMGKIIEALPLNPNSKSFPVIGEQLVLIPSPKPNASGPQFFYDKPLGLFGSSTPNGNIFPSLTQNVSPPSQNVTYSQIESGAVNIIDPNPVQAPSSSPTDPNQTAFAEKSDIHPLMPFIGDILYEGRWGQSLRFGSTSKSNSQWKNNWSTSGENGDPIMVIRNGQPKDASSYPAYLPISEDINKDLSSIYLTSQQKIPFNSELPFNSYKSNKPTQLSEYTSPQTILNSSRIVLRATNDHVLITGQQSVNLHSVRYVNIDSPNTVIQSTNIFLGDKDATEPGIKGDKLYNKLDTMLQALITLIRVLEVQQLWPAGLSSPDGGTMMVSSVTKQQLIATQNSLNEILSQVVKIK
jgi:hypothetical protein